jgi:DNA-binding MarR family transcriptional regulator
MALSRRRELLLAAGISAVERKSFCAVIQALTVRAAQIYADERRLSAEAAAAGQCPPPPPIPSFETVEDKHGVGKLLVPQLNALTSYLRRSAMLTYQREQGLSNFQWMILSQIGEYEPLPLARLIEIMGRDKSQVGRTVAHFEEAGLIERRRVERKRDIMVTTTPRGAAVYEKMCAIALQRDESLTEGLSAAERAFFIEIIERLDANARQLLKAGQTERAAG